MIGTIFRRTAGDPRDPIVIHRDYKTGREAEKHPNNDFWRLRAKVPWKAKGLVPHGEVKTVAEALLFVVTGRTV